MRINDVLRNKGNQVVTIRSDATVGDLVDLLGEHGIGAVVVVDDPEAPTPVGIVSERDVVRRLRDGGVDYLASPVARIMTTDVLTCQPDDEIEGVARQLTEHRIRHLPVLADGRLAGIVSIGDVVKQRMDELQAERDHLTTYIQG